MKQERVNELKGKSIEIIQSEGQTDWGKDLIKQTESQGLIMCDWNPQRRRGKTEVGKNI